MTWGETATTQRRGNGQANKQSRCFALTSIELLGVSQSSVRRLPSRKFDFTRSVFGFQKSNLAVRFLFKKRLTIELTWGETDYTQAKGKKTT